jgi:lipoate-protein ligase A
MERDRELWQRFEADPSPGVRLRIYGWQPAALSLGFHQPRRDVDREALVPRGIDLVRRPTGGAAVLHADEITYSVAAPLGLTGLGSAVLEIHAAIAEALAKSLGALGVTVDFGGGGQPRDFACFSGAGGHELTVAGRKLVGSALRRGRHGFLQHGSVLRGEEHLDLCRFMAGLSAEEREDRRAALLQKTCTLGSIGAAAVDEVALGSELAARLGRACGFRVRRVPDFAALVAL